MTSTAARRIAAAALGLAGIAALVSGVGAWMVSGCCGSPEPPEEGYLLVGALGAAILWTAAATLLRRRPPG